MLGVARRYVTAALTTAIALVIAACGGGGNTEENDGPRLTDPASVETTNRLDPEMVYHIGDNTIEAPSGVTGDVGGDDDPAVTAGNGDGDTGGTGETYTVQPGDTCNAIASSLGVSLEGLLGANPQIDANCTNILPGDELTVPATVEEEPADEPVDEPADEPADEPEPEPEPATQEYVVQQGDNCQTIANAHGVDVDELVRVNNIDCTALQIDQVIQIP